MIASGKLAKRLRRLVLSAVSLTALCAGHASAQSLREAVSATLQTNPQLGQALENRSAIEFELRQAKGLYLPRVDFESSLGARRLERPETVGGVTTEVERNLKARDAGLVVTWKIFDGFGRESEVERQTARVSSAGFRVLDRSEALALEVTREYLETLLSQRLVQLADQNIRYLETTARRIREIAAGGSLTDADIRQSQERVLAARARAVEARQELASGKIRLLRLAGRNVTRPTSPPSFASKLPRSVNAALQIAVTNNPRLSFANADIDAANALVKRARARMLPEVSLEGRARGGMDIDGVNGRTNDLQARAILRWNLYNGGIDDAAIKEQTHRVGESLAVRDQITREVEESVRLAYERRDRQSQAARILSAQVNAGNGVVAAYAEQFQVGRRSLLDLLDAQNTRYNANVLLETARVSAMLAEYRILASTGQLVAAFGLKAPRSSQEYNAAVYGSNATGSYTSGIR